MRNGGVCAGEADDSRIDTRQKCLEHGWCVTVGIDGNKDQTHMVNTVRISQYVEEKRRQSSLQNIPL